MEKTKIEWCDSSWNPISGCLHECPYCYARGTANRFKGCDLSPDGSTNEFVMELNERLKVTGKDGEVRNAAFPFGFTPTLHRYRLDDPVKRGFGKTIFVCSTADMFGEWVSDEWIEDIFNACKRAENHRYLFLTKNPGRYMRLAEKGKLPEVDNFWYGSTATGPDVPVFFSNKHHTFVSVEPVLEPFINRNGECGLKEVEWLILGAETGNRKEKVRPEREWVEDLVSAFRKEGKPVFMKDSMKPVWGDEIPTEYPWDAKL